MIITIASAILAIIIATIVLIFRVRLTPFATKKFVLNYIRKHAYDGTSEFAQQIMKACHESRQSHFDEQSTPGRIYEVVEDCVKGIVWHKNYDLGWKEMTANAIKTYINDWMNITEPLLEQRLTNKSW